MRLHAAWLVVLLAAGATVAGGRDLECVAGFCVGEPFEIAAAGEGWEFADWPEPETCTQVSGGRLPAGVAMMLLEGRIARFETSSGSQRGGGDAPFGLRPGMSLAEAGARFPPDGLELDFHKYAWPPGLYLTWRDPTRNRAVRVELPDDTVDVILWGSADAVELSEGCA